MNLRQMKQVVTLAETGNFHRAAERLCMEQPPLSVSIRKLEEALGGPLFVRTTTGVRTTSACEALLPLARECLHYADQACRTVELALRGEGGRLRIAFVGSATHEMLARIIGSFRKRYPAVKLELSEGTSRTALEDVVAHRLDAAIVRYPVLHPGPYEILELDRDHFVLAVPARSEFAQARRIVLRDAAQSPFVMYSSELVPSLSAVAMMRCQYSGFVPRIAQEATQVQTILSMVESGLGVALVPGVTKRLRPRGIRFLDLEDNPRDFRLGLALAFLPDLGNQVAQRFVEHVRDLLASDEAATR